MTRFACRRCGLRVITWTDGQGGVRWKHAAGWKTGKGCGRVPIVVEEER
jgi:hypothetical protein